MKNSSPGCSLHRLSACAIVVIVALSASTRQATTQSGPVQYGVSAVGTLGGASVALGMSAEAFPSIVGYSTTATGADHAFSMRSGGMRDLGTLGGARSEARAAARDIVGRAQVPSGAYHAFSYAGSGPMRDLGTLGGTESYATANNGWGVTVGVSQTPGNATQRAFIFQNDVMADLGAALGGPNTAAMAIRDDGTVAGYADLPGGQVHHAFVYANGVTTDLGAFGQSSQAYAINDSGVVVGRSQLATGTNHHAFRYANGLMQDLGTLGGASSEALAVNNPGAAVGWAETAAGERHAFIWRDGVLSDLNATIPPGTGWVLQAATGINSVGQIAGWGLLDGQLRAFVLTPPIDLSVDLRVHENLEDTNIPNPIEAGRTLLLGVTVRHNAPYSATGVTIVDTISGPVEYVSWNVNGTCEQSGQQLTCRVAPVEVIGRDLMIQVRTTGAGPFHHSASVRGDQPDPDTSNNSASESNTAVSLAAFTLTPTTVTGGNPSLGRTTLTSRTPDGGAPITLTSSNPDVAQVPSVFHVLPTSGDGLFREFYVTTRAVSAPTTVQIGATYGLVTITVPLTIVPSSSQSPFGGAAHVIPGTIEAEDFDEGGEGVAYHDVTSGNEGGAYRPTDVDLQSTLDGGGGVNVGWARAGEWLEYTVNVAAAGAYTFEARVASPGVGGTFHVEMNGADKTGALTLPATGSWQAWQTITTAVTLDAGVQVMRLSFDSPNPNGGSVGNFNYVRLAAASAPGTTPYGGTPWAVPGRIEAENFDDGGEGFAYHDTTSENSGGQYRPTGVDIQLTGDAGGGYNVGWMTSGEWLHYTVNVASAGTYTLTARVAANGAGGAFHVEFGGVNRTGTLTIPDTGSWQAWTDVTAPVTLAAGIQGMRVVADANGPAGVFGNLNFITLAGDSTALSDVVLYSTDWTRHGAWVLQNDSSAAAGVKTLTPDAGWSTTSTPLAGPADYLEATFDAAASTPYAIWLRLRATGDTKYSESVWVQFSGARAGGNIVYPIGTTSALLVNLEPCYGCGVSGWGWQNGAYWLAQATTVTFAASGPHTIRIQVREDGAQIDQIVLSPSRYLASAPGPVRDDGTIVSK